VTTINLNAITKPGVGHLQVVAVMAGVVCLHQRRHAQDKRYSLEIWFQGYSLAIMGTLFDSPNGERHG